MEAESPPTQVDNPGQSKQQREFGQTGHHRGADGKRESTPPGKNLQSDKQSSDYEGLARGNAAPSRGKSSSLPYAMHDMQKKQLEDADLSPVRGCLEKVSRPFGPEVAAASPAT